jgi:hypothetical protein
MITNSIRPRPVSMDRAAGGLAPGFLSVPARLVLLVAAAGLGCGDDGARIISDGAPLEPAGGDSPRSAIAVLSRVCGPDTCLSYLNSYESVEAMQAAGTIDRTRGVEVPYSQGRVYDGSIYLFNRDEPTITRWTLEDDLSFTERERISFANTGTDIFCEICNVFASPELAYHVDAFTGGVVVAWNPRTMEILATSEVPAAIMGKLPGGTAELVFPTSAGGRAFYTASWTNSDTLEVHPGLAVLAFDTSTPTPELRLIEDDRCGGSYVMSPFADGEGNVYVAGDWVGGFYQAGIPGSARAPACLLRLPSGAQAFDPSYHVDLLAVSGAQAIRTAFALPGGKRLLLNILPAGAPGVSEQDFQSNPLAWYDLTEFTYVVLDLDTLTVTPVTAFAPAAAGNASPLGFDDHRFVQVYPEGVEGAELYEVGADASAVRIVGAGSNGDFSMIGRVR